jgi:hypothetical protein
MKKLTTTLIFIGLLTACTSVNKPITDAEKAEIRSTVLKEFNEAVEGQRSLNWEKVLGLYKLDEDFSWIYGGKVNIGAESFKKMVESFVPNIKEYLYMESPNLKVIVLDRDFALVLDEESKESFIMTNGDTIISKGAGSYLLQRFDTLWKVIHQNTVSLDAK